MVGPTAAQSQYLLGLKHRELIMSPPSRVYKCLPSFKSHSIAIPSLPPDAHKEPSGDTVTTFRYPWWPMWLVLRRQFVRFHTFGAKKKEMKSLLPCFKSTEVTASVPILTPSAVVNPKVIAFTWTIQTFKSKDWNEKNKIKYKILQLWHWLSLIHKC